MPNPVAIFETSLGTYKAELFVDTMPVTAGRVLELIRAGFYDGLHFHRVISGFMIQFGCPHSRDPCSPRCGTGGAPQGNLADEFPRKHKLSNEVGTLAMANTGQPDTGSSQFFVNTAHNRQLDWFRWFGRIGRHPVFGRVIEGMDVVERIEAVPTDETDRPQTPVKVIRVTVEG